MYDMIAYRGEPLRRTFIVKENGVVKNLTGYTAKMVLTDVTETKLTWSDDTGEIVIDAAAGKLTLSLAEEDVDALAFTAASYRLTITENGNVTPILTGSLTVEG